MKTRGFSVELIAQRHNELAAIVLDQSPDRTGEHSTDPAYTDPDLNWICNNVTSVCCRQHVDCHCIPNNRPGKYKTRVICVGWFSEIAAAAMGSHPKTIAKKFQILRGLDRNHPLLAIYKATQPNGKSPNGKKGG